MTKCGSDDFKPLNQYLRKFQKQRLRRYDNSIPSGFVDLDKITGGGFQRSDLIVLAARPATGRTSLALSVAANAGLRIGAASEIHIAFDRSGPTGQVSLLFNQQTAKFLDLEVHHEPVADTHG